MCQETHSVRYDVYSFAYWITLNASIYLFLTLSAISGAQKKKNNDDNDNNDDDDDDDVRNNIRMDR